MTPKDRFQRDMEAFKELPNTIMQSFKENTELARQNFENIPYSMIQDMKEVPHLQAKALVEGPNEARKEAREYLEGKRKVAPLTVIDLIVDLIDTVLPG